MAEYMARSGLPGSSGLYVLPCEPTEIVWCQRLSSNCQENHGIVWRVAQPSFPKCLWVAHPCGFDSRKVGPIFAGLCSFPNQSKSRQAAGQGFRPNLSTDYLIDFVTRPCYPKGV